ncbi:hypothetical protein [Prevotella fusca]
MADKHAALPGFTSAGYSEENRLQRIIYMKINIFFHEDNYFFSRK